MDLYRQLFKRIFAQAAAMVAMLLACTVVYAQVRDTLGQEVITTHAFPGTVETVGWENAEAVLTQNLSGDALYQDFNKINAAYLPDDVRTDRVRRVNINSNTDDAADEIPATTTAPVATTTDSDITDEVESGASSEAVVPTPVPEVLPTPPSSETTTIAASTTSTTETEPVAATTSATDGVESEPTTTSTPAIAPESTTATTTVLQRMGDRFTLAFSTMRTLLPFAQSATTTTATDEPEPTEETEETAEEVPVGDTGLETEENESTEPEEGDDVVESAATSSEVEVATDATTIATSTERVTATSTSTSTTPVETAADTPEEVVEEPADDEVTEPTPKPTEPAETKNAISMTLRDFGVPELTDNSQRVVGGQLRLSFAAKQRSTRLDESATFRVEYSLDNGERWSSGGEINVVDEVSNSLNGDHFLFALPVLGDAEDLRDLAVRVVYEDDRDTLQEAFIEAAWLEIFTQLGELDPVDSLANFDDNFQNATLEGDTLVLPDGERITFDFTDNNHGEDLIIKSDDVRYQGLSEATMYFNVTNTSNDSDNFSVKTYFPNNVGEVTSLQVWNQNRPRKVVIPEYRPFVYHCQGGWGDVPEEMPDTVPARDEAMLVPDIVTEPATATPRVDDEVVSNTTTTTAEVVVPEPVIEPPSATPSTTIASTSEPLSRFSQSLPFAQAATTTLSSDIASTSVTTDEESLEESTSEYYCAATQVVQRCDELGGDGTQCTVTQKLVAEHERTAYRSGWDAKPVSTSTKKTNTSRAARLSGLLGVGPAVKPVPDEFEARAETPETFTIQPGETRYFKMEISYPPFTQGEFWIEAIGSRAYGLLDPFWSSQWRYRKPIVIDNTSGAERTEQQVFVELTSADSDFWSNVKSDGGDIRFVRETEGNELTWWDDDWGRRLTLTIPASQVDDDVTDFPVYVDLATLGSDFFADVQADGDDIRILDSTGSTEMAYDLVAINTGSETGELHFEATSLSSSVDNVFYIYFDNPGASGYAAGDTYGSEAVWDNNFDLRYAMDDDPTSGGDQFDSTSNGNDAPARSGMSAGDVVTGQIGEAINHDGNDGGIFNSALAYPGEFTASMWWRSTGDGFAISTNAGSNEKFGPWSGGNTFVRMLNGGGNDQTIASPADGTWAHVVLTRDSANKVDLYIDGVQNRLFGDSGQSGVSTWENFGGQTSQGFQGDLDELRFASVKRSDGWVSTEHNNQSNPGAFYATSSVESLTFTSFTELDHWVQYFDSTVEEADIWVQVDTMAAAASTTIHLYYGNEDAESVSDEFAPFTYSTTTDLYYVVNDSQTSPIVVYSLIDNNEVSIDGGVPVILQAGETTSFSTYASTSVISALGPVTARTVDDSSEPPVPISFATTTFLTANNRGSSDFYVYAPLSTTDVRVFQGPAAEESASSTVLVDTAATYNVAQGGSDFGVVESDEPILLYHNSDSDSFVVYPPTTRDLYGIRSNNYHYGSIEDGVSVEIYCSGGANGTTTGINRGVEETNDFCSNGSNGAGDAVRLTNATGPMAAIQQADGGGTESSSFLPTPEFGTIYYLPQPANYAVIACAPRFGSVDVEIQNTVGGTVTSGTCTPSGDDPGHLLLNTAAPYTQGYSVVSTNGVPFYTYYDSDGPDDETNTWSAVQAKQYNALYMPFTIGAEEVNTDAQYEQNNYGWYENIDDETPTDSWPLGDGETAGEGEAIDSGGAVNPGDVLRLRMNLLANNGTGTVDSTAFALQYAEAETCSAVVGDAWITLADVGSTTPAFAGYDNATPADGTTLPSVLLSDSDVAATYEEESPSALLPNEVASSSAVEFDWVIEVVAPNVNSEYCFRMIRSTQEPLPTYSSYPELLTAGPPERAVLLSPFDNEHATSTNPDLRFVAADLGQDNLDYQIQIATDADFSSIVVDSDSDSDPFDFENINTSADKAPFNNGQAVRYILQSSLSNGQTYWWRVRAIDPDGSNTYGVYSESRSFTINTAVVVSEWFQTTDDQFETNTLTSATTSGSGSVELDIAGSNLVGEYGSVDLTNGATTTVSLDNTYSNPVVVASIRYSRSVPNGDQPAARVSSKTGTSFDVRADNYTNDAPGTSTVDYMVLEAGEWLIDDGGDGLRVYATSTNVSVTAGSSIPGDPGGTVVSYPTSFSSAPAVLTMVSSANDPQWVVSSVYDGNNISNPPTASELTVYMNDNLVSDGHGATEVVDVVVLDLGTGDNNNVVFDILTTATDVTDTPNTEPFNATFGSTPQTTLVQTLTMNGAQGGYAMVDLDNPTTVSDITVSIEEGGPADRGHAAEQVAIVAFEDASGDIIRGSTAQIVSSVIDYDDAVVGNAWGEVSWNDTGDIEYHLEYNTGSGFTDIPDSALPGNSSGFTSSPIDIVDLDTETYNQIRIVADLSGVNPELYDWTVSWGERVEVPTLGDPFDNEKTADTTPTFDFFSTDPEGDSLTYEISYSTDPTFSTGSTTITSSTSVDFANSDTPVDVEPFNSGETVTYTVPGGSALTNGETYWWRVRAKDPTGSNSFSPWSEADNFTVDTAVGISTWFQTTQAQFQEGVLDGVVATSSGSVELTSEIGEYGTTTLTGNDWATIDTRLTYDNMVVVASPVYDFDTGLDNGRTPQVRNKNGSSFEIKVENATLSLTGPTVVHYMVMEAGDWTIDDGAGGTRIVAGTAAEVSAVRGSSAGYSGGTTVDFTPDFGSAPAVFATVSTANGDKWVATVLDDGSQQGEVTAADMNVSLGVGYDTDTIRDPEDVDYIAAEVTTGTNNGVLFDSFNSGNSVTHNDTSVSFNQTFSSTPGVILVHNNATNGADGGFAQVDTGTAADASQVNLSIAEIPANGNHASEVVSLLAFASESGTILRDDNVGGGLVGTIASEPVLFSDGLGPKFDRALFGATTPGNSTTSLQVQYLTSTSSWALIPDGQLAGNSAGFSSSPVDLSGINVATYPVIRLLGTLNCDGANCPTLDDWTVEWSEGVEMTGTLQAYDRLTNVANATVTVSINGAPPTRTGTVSGGTWSISNVTAFAGDVLTVFVDGAADANEAVGVFVYDGLGDMTGVELFEGHLTLSADEDQEITLADLAVGDNGQIGDEDVFFDVLGGDLTVCAVGTCSNNNLYVGSGDIFTISTSTSRTTATHDFINDGTVAFDNNVMEVSGSWTNNATTTLDTSTVTLTAATGTETLSDTSGVLNFYNLTFGAGSGTATWQPQNPLDIQRDLTVAYGTLDRSTYAINVARALSTGAAGFWSGVGTTTFDGSGTAGWSDSNATPQDIGYAVIDGAARTVTVGSDVRASSITIGANDTLNAGGNNDIYLSGNFVNNNVFSAQTSQIIIDGTATAATITSGGSSLYALRASSTGGSIAFTEGTVTLLDNLTIATGTVTFPTTELNIGGSLINEAGALAHNNGLLDFVGNGTESITLLGTAFLNGLYDVRFSGGGDWTFTDTNATTSGSVSIESGDVTFPSGQLSVGRDFDVSGTGAFDANDGEVLFLVQSSDQVTTNGSAFNDVRVRELVGSLPWYDDNWASRVQVTIRASEIDDDVSNFPVYVDLADFNSDFFAQLNSDGGDIRVTEGDGVTEVPREVVSASTTAETGELWFRATSLSSTTDTTFYVYHGNGGASDYAATDPFGSENVWSNGYVLVSHQYDETTSTLINSADGSGAHDGTKDAANQPVETDAGWIYEAQDFSGTGHIEYPNVGDNATQITVSAWINPDNLTGGGDTSTYGFTVFSAHSASNYTWLTAGGTNKGSTEMHFCAFHGDANGCSSTTGANLSTGEWRYVSATGIDGGAATIRLEDTELASFTSDGGGTWNSVSTIGDLRPDRSIEFEGLIDELQVSNVVRSVAWQDATYRNQATTTDFYAASAPQSGVSRTFADTNTTIAGNLIIESGDVLFPTGVLSIGGSLDNDSEFDSNMGTVAFTTATGSATVAPGISTFYNLQVNSTGGSLTITENATATNAITLSAANDFTLGSGLTLESQGDFTNTASSSGTTWTGSTLRLSSGADVLVNSTTDEGDSYATIETTPNTAVAWWNSDASTYSLAASSSVYSQDHAGVDGDLYIFGEYERTSGTEYWSYATDWDGTNLLGGSERAANVRIDDGARVRIASATMQALGTSTASTTVDAQTGGYGWILDSATLEAQYLTVTGGNAAGLQLLGSTTVSSFANTAFTIPVVSAAISLSGTTIDTNPATQFFGVDFVSGGGSTNVNLTSTSSSFWWFRDGEGDRYGEAFDNGDGDPGSVRWDDSSYQINISGTVYSDNGVTPQGGPVCDGSTQNIRVVVDGGTYTDTTSCDGITGAYSFSNVAYVGDPVIHVYLDTAGGTPGAVVTKTPTSDLTDLDVYANRIIARHENTVPLTIADMAVYDSNDDADLPYVAATSGTPSLTTNSDMALYVWNNNTFAPEGPVTLEANATGNSYDGTLYLGPGATFTASGTTLYTVGGSLVAANGASLETASSTFVFNATTTGKTINASSTLAFNELTFTGAAGSWSVDSAITVAGDVAVDAGTVTGVGDITLFNGSLSGNGLVDMTGGTVAIYEDNTLGGSSPWSFHNLTLGSGSVAGITTPASNATTTIKNVFTIAAAHFYDAGAATVNLAGSGNVFIENGTFLEDTSTVQYSGAVPNVLRTTYYNMLVDDATTSVSATAPSTGLQILNNLTIGTQGTASLNLTTNDPTVAIGGNTVIGAGGTLLASDVSTLQAFGNWDNAGTFTSNGGLVSFVSPDAATVDSGASSFANVRFNAAGPFVVTSNATATGDYLIATTTQYTQQSGTTLAVGGTFTNQTDGLSTTWTGSTLSLYSGTSYVVNGKNRGDNYETVQLADGTHVRFWDSSFGSVVTNDTSSLYSMDHDNTAGDLYIFGDYVNNNFTDDWSYTRDWDGTALGGSARQASVYVEGGGSLQYNGGEQRIQGTSTASTTVQNQGSGTFTWQLSGTADVTMQYVVPRNVDATGIQFTGTPDVNDISRVDFLVTENNARALTIDGAVINANPALNLDSNVFNESGGLTNPINASTTGSTVSSWRFTNESGNLAGEAYDADAGDPGEIVWTDSAALITISGNIYEDEGITPYSQCDGSTNNVQLVVAGLTSASTTCAGGSGFYQFTNVGFSPADSIVVYINGEAESGATVTVDPASNIANMDVYTDRVIVRHEGANPIEITDLAVWDSSNDGDIPFTAVTGSPDTLTLPTDTELIVWNNKRFAPNGNVTTTAGTNGFSGDVTLFANAQFIASTTETHTVGGSFEAQAGASLTAAESSFDFTSTQGGEIIDVNESSFHTLAFSGSGAWSVADATLTATDSFTVSGAGAVTLPNATTTVGEDFNVSSGSIDANGGTILLQATDVGNTLALNGSSLATLIVDGVGGAYSMTDTNATATATVRIDNGSLTFPSGTFAIGEDLVINDTMVNNGGTVAMTGTAAHTITLNSNDLGGLSILGTGTFTMTDAAAAILGDFTIATGTITTATNTLAIGGSLDATGGTVNFSSSTVLFDSVDTGEVVNPGGNVFYNVVVDSATGGWTFVSATTSAVFTLDNASVFTLAGGETLRVDGVFTNNVGGAATTWSAGSTLVLGAGQTFTVSDKTTNTEVYDAVRVINDTDVRFWQSSFATTSLSASSSIYSQDHAGSNGTLLIAGEFEIDSSDEFWSYATDFDGTGLSGGARRAVTVTFDDTTNALLRMTGGSLSLEGAASATTTVTALGSGTHAMQVQGGSFTATYYEFNQLDLQGLDLSGTPNIVSLNNGHFIQGIDIGALVTLERTTLNANAGLLINNVQFDDGGFIPGDNVVLSATSTNAWQFRDHSGNLDGEDYDIDGTDDCGSIRWDNSDCQLLEQTSYRWRNDDGGLGVPSSEWFDSNWDKRQRVRLESDSVNTFSSTSAEIVVAYDANMQSDFSDLRFTAADGVTEVPYWIERVDTGVAANVWLFVDELPARDTATFFMYYDNISATSNSSSTAVFTAVDDFEDSSLSEYSGDSFYEASTDEVYGGAYALAPQSGSEGNRANSGIARFDQTVSQGDMLRFRQYVDTSAGSDDETCVLFGVQSPVTANQNYGVCLEQFGTDRLVIVEDAESTDTYGSVSILASTTVTYTTGWYEVLIDWQTDDSIAVQLYSPSGALVASTTASDETYTSGGYGFTSWGQNGAWDSFVSFPRWDAAPTVFFGDEQTEGGASWNAPLNTSASNVTLGSPIRLRVALENSGLDLASQQYTLESAPLGGVGSCEAVDSGDFTAVPPQASCGSNGICMAASSNLTNYAATTDLLLGSEGTFVAGEAVEDPVNQTTVFDFASSTYTELEYVLTPTVNVTDEAYCFRVTNGGAELDSYAVIPQMSLEFAPTVDTVSLNDGLNIDLALGTTTPIVASTTVTDLNGFADITAATTTFYKSDVAGLADCTPDNNNCYRTTLSDSCSLVDCSGNSCSLQCTADFAFHTDPTDSDGGVFWYAYVEVGDSTDNTDFNTSPANDVNTLRGLTVQNAIDYGSLGVNTNTGSYNASTTVINIGNEAIDVDVLGTDLSDGAASVIDVAEQRFATSTFTYSSCTVCSTLNETGVTIELDLAKPTSTSPAVTDELYWGINIPFGINSAPHSGTNSFIATGD